MTARCVEIAGSLAGLHEAANQYFDGSSEALIRHHAASIEPVFKGEAETAREITSGRRR